MGGEVHVADSKPGRLPQPLKRLERYERVALEPVAGLVIESTGEPVDGSVEVRAHEQAPELVVVSGVGNHRELTSWQHRLQARREHGPSGASGEDDHPHRNRSHAAGRISSLPRPLPSSSRPRTTTTGVRSVFPITRPAAAATSSATASTVACSSLPASS